MLIIEYIIHNTNSKTNKDIKNSYNPKNDHNYNYNYKNIKSWYN